MSYEYWYEKPVDCTQKKIDISKKSSEFLKSPKFKDSLYYFAKFNVNILEFLPKGQKTIFDGEDLRIEVNPVIFPLIHFKFSQRLREKKHTLDAIVDFNQYKKEVIKVHEKIVAFLKELNNPKLLNHPDVEDLVALEELVQTDYFETLYIRSNEQLIQDLTSLNIYIKRNAELSLDYNKKLKSL